jgi:hypothetical protein
VLRSDPTARSDTIIATAINAAINPYSIAVAPSSSFKNLVKRNFIAMLLPLRLHKAEQDAPPLQPLDKMDNGVEYFVKASLRMRPEFGQAAR